VLEMHVFLSLQFNIDVEKRNKFITDRELNFERELNKLEGNVHRIFSGFELMVDLDIVLKKVEKCGRRHAKSVYL
jgi:hypothetical protein